MPIFALNPLKTVRKQFTLRIFCICIAKVIWKMNFIFHETYLPLKLKT